jgi:hypothetical protein
LVERDGFASPDCRQDLVVSEAAEAMRLFLDLQHEQLVALVAAT